MKTVTLFRPETLPASVDLSGRGHRLEGWKQTQKHPNKKYQNSIQAQM